VRAASQNGQREIGERVGQSQTHVARILRSSIRTTRRVARTAA
jgi:DNA-directed RNA polymerase specialized sigma subunit